MGCERINLSLKWRINSSLGTVLAIKLINLKTGKKQFLKCKSAYETETLLLFSGNLNDRSREKGMGRSACEYCIIRVKQNNKALIKFYCIVCWPHVLSYFEDNFNTDSICISQRQRLSARVFLCKLFGNIVDLNQHE